MLQRLKEGSSKGGLGLPGVREGVGDLRTAAGSLCSVVYDRLTLKCYNYDKEKQFLIFLAVASATFELSAASSGKRYKLMAGGRLGSVRVWLDSRIAGF